MVLVGLQCPLQGDRQLLVDLVYSSLDVHLKAPLRCFHTVLQNTTHQHIHTLGPAPKANVVMGNQVSYTANSDLMVYIFHAVLLFFLESLSPPPPQTQSSRVARLRTLNKHKMSPEHTVCVVVVGETSISIWHDSLISDDIMVIL